jgi:hypothetical protein
MKKRNRTLVLVVGLCIILAFPALVDASSLVIYDSATKTVTVAPTGVDDTANIQAAFNWAVLQGAGATVQLTEGNFYTNDVVVKDFDGTFKGAGEHSTVIDTLRGINPDADPVPVYEGTDDHGNELSLSPTLFVFEGGGDITIKDMGFDITHPDPGVLDDYLHGILGTWISTILITKRSPEFYSCDKEVVVEDLRFDANIGSYGWPNVLDGMYIGGMTHPDAAHPNDRRWSVNPFTATIRVSECTSNIANYPIVIGGLTNGGATIERNVVYSSHIGVFCGLLDNADIEIKRNYVEATYFGMWAMQERGGPAWPGEGPALPDAPARVSMVHNTIHVFWAADGIGLTDYLGSGLRAVVSSNEIFLYDNLWGGIFAWDVKDAVITNNIISGSGVAGIYMGIWGDPCSGWTILGNNVENVVDSPYWGWSTGVWLGVGTSYCTVVGSRMSVSDEGYENTIVGINNMGNPPGQDIADALEQKRNMIGP